MNSSPRASNKILGIVFFTVFLDLVGFGIIIPIQPFLAGKLGASPKVITLLGASFSLMQFLFAHFWGRLSDKVGRRPVMLTSIAVNAIGYFIFAGADTLFVLFLARMLAGFGSANIGAAQAIISDSTDPKERAKGMGLIGVAFGMGFILGPAIGAFFGQFALSTPAYVASFLCVLNWLIAYFRLPETNPVGKRAEKTKRPNFSLNSFKHACRHKNVSRLFLVYIIYATAFSMMEQVLGLFVEAHWVKDTALLLPEFHSKRAAALTGYILIVVGITAAFVQGRLIGKIVPKYGEKKILFSGLLLVSVALFAMPFVGMIEIYPLMFLNAALLAAGSGCTNPTLASLLSQSVDKNEQGGVLGLGQSLSGLGRVIGPAVSGVLFEFYAGVPFWVGSLLILGTSLIVTRIQKPTLTNS